MARLGFWILVVGPLLQQFLDCLTGLGAELFLE